MYRKLIILFFCMIFVASSAFSQYFSPLIGSEPVFSGKVYKVHTAINSTLPRGFYVSQLGFFCRKEWKMESAWRLPVRIRLGTVAQCDWMEGKPNTHSWLLKQ